MRFCYFFLTLIASLSACTPKIDPDFPKGQFISIEPQSISEITINSYKNEKNWSATFKKQTEENWNIAEGPDSLPLLDTQTNDSFLNHLIDLIPTLSNLGNTPSGTDEQLGLDHPNWLIIVGTPRNSREIELRVGGTDTQSGGFITKVSFAGTTKTLLLQGAFFGLLDYIKGYQYLRKPTLSGFKMGDIYKIELENGKQKSQADKQVNEWLNVKQKDISESIVPWLERFMHLQIKTFIDQKNEQESLAKAALNSLEKASITLSNFEDKKEKWDFFRINKKIFVRSSSRNNLFFELHSEAWSTTKFSF